MSMASVAYKLCPRCFRAVPLESEELHCPNDGEELLERCPHCAARILSPYAHFCVKCGQALGPHAVATHFPGTERGWGP